MNGRGAAIPMGLMAAFLSLAPGAPTSAQTPPFAEAVRAGDMLYLSGQIGARAGAAGPVPGGLEAETRQAMDNIGAVLRRHGLGFGDVVRCLALLTDMDRWGAFNRIYRGYFPPDRLPARSAAGVAALALGAQVEIECTARFPDPPPRAVSAGASLGPYSPAILSDGLIHISGVIPFDAAAKRFAAPDMGAQMAQAFANLDAVLKAAGASRRDVVRATLYLRSAADKPAADAAWSAYFGTSAPPARTTVAGLDWGRDDLRVEIDATARLPEEGR